MPTYDKVVLTEQARSLGFLTAPFEKMTRLTEILRFLNISDKLKDSCMHRNYCLKTMKL